MRTALSLGTVLWVVIGITGCIDPFSANVKPPSPRPLVVEGHVTSGKGPHTVTLSLAAAFEQSLEGSTERVDEAQVVIVDDSANKEVLLHETSAGTYKTKVGDLNGIPGHAYHLEVTLSDGRQYRSHPERMPPPVPLDSLTLGYDASAKQIKVFANAHDPSDTSNFYRWSVRITRQIVNPEALSPPFYCWKNVSPSRISVLSDRLIDGGRIVDEPVFSIEPGLSATYLNQVDVQQRTITEQAHDFWTKVEEQVENTGDPFSAPPAPIRGNVVRIEDSSEAALGYFEVAGASSRATACVQQSDVSAAPTPTDLPTNGCPVRGVTFDAPSFWTCSSSRNP